MALPGGMTTSDFSGFPLSDFGRTVSRTPITKTLDNISGREILTEGTPADITAMVSIRDITWTQDEVLKLEGNDGIIMVNHDVTLNEQDYVTFDSKTYEVKNLVTIKPAGTAMFKYGLLLLKE